MDKEVMTAEKAQGDPVLMQKAKEDAEMMGQQEEVAKVSKRQKKRNLKRVCSDCEYNRTIKTETREEGKIYDIKSVNSLDEPCEKFDRRGDCAMVAKAGITVDVVAETDVDTDKVPTMDYLKREIQEYLDKQGIKYRKKDTKPQLIAKIK